MAKKLKSLKYPKKPKASASTSVMEKYLEKCKEIQKKRADIIKEVEKKKADIKKEQAKRKTLQKKIEAIKR